MSFWEGTWHDWLSLGLLVLAYLAFLAALITDYWFTFHGTAQRRYEKLVAERQPEQKPKSACCGAEIRIVNLWTDAQEYRCQSCSNLVEIGQTNDNVGPNALTDDNAPPNCIIQGQTGGKTQ